MLMKFLKIYRDQKLKEQEEIRDFQLNQRSTYTNLPNKTVSNSLKKSFLKIKNRNKKLVPIKEGVKLIVNKRNKDYFNENNEKLESIEKVLDQTPNKPLTEKEQKITEDDIKNDLDEIREDINKFALKNIENIVPSLRSRTLAGRKRHPNNNLNNGYKRAHPLENRIVPKRKNNQNNSAIKALKFRHRQKKIIKES